MPPPQPDIRYPLKGISNLAPKVCTPLRLCAPPLHRSPSFLPSRSFDFRRRVCHSCLTLPPSHPRPSLFPSFPLTNSYFSNFDFYGNDIERTDEGTNERERRATEDDVEAFSSQNDGNCSSNDRTEGEEGRKEGRKEGRPLASS